jgi:NADP-dependent 3-hydroxy acid dehydrogenase YdfG
VKAFTKGLFGEMRDLGIKATAVFPGVTDTALTGELDAKMIDSSKLMGTESIADAVLFALKQPANVCPTDLSVINQHSVWKQRV